KVSVIASREAYEKGHRKLATQGFAETDDLGQFRLYGLAPGRYYVSASEQMWRNTNGDREFAVGNEAERAYTKTYYPGTPDPGKAATISLKEGEEIPGVDIALKQAVVHRIRGKVFNLVTHKGGSDTELGLVSRNQRVDWDFSVDQQVKK